MAGKLPELAFNREFKRSSKSTSLFNCTTVNGATARRTRSEAWHMNVHLHFQPQSSTEYIRAIQSYALVAWVLEIKA